MGCRPPASGPPRSPIVTGPVQLVLASHSISKVEPAGITSPLVGLVIGSKPGVWAKTELARARNAVLTVKRILNDQSKSAKC